MPPVCNDATTHRPALLVACADIGSIPKRRFAWASSDDAKQEMRHDRIEALVDHIRGSLSAGRSVALGIEAPLSFRDSEDPGKIGCARPEDGARAWSAGAGATVLPTALAQLRWILWKLCDPPPRTGLRLTFDQRDLNLPEPVLMIWEAMVTGQSKKSQGSKATRSTSSHYADAHSAMTAFLDAIEHDPASLRPEDGCVSLAGMLVDALQLPQHARLASIAPPIVRPT